MTPSPYLVKPGSKFRLGDADSGEKGDFKDKEAGEAATAKNLEKLHELQELLYAEAKHAVLVVIQAMDTGGKDGAIESVFRGVNPQGCNVTSFKVPTPLEKAHDFMWRYHLATPPKGIIGIFNRSHYESVLVERVHEYAPEKVWKGRYDHINAWEAMLADEGVTVLKFYLHISKDEQKKRLESRLAEKQKHWKFNPGDLDERKFWNEYQDAYQDALAKCSTEAGPWYCVPADRKWFRNWVISDVLVRTLESLDMKYPAAAPGLDKVVVV
jgi:PPK2 family polyphosphate:nucleotide phosphotransferase